MARSNRDEILDQLRRQLERVAPTPSAGVTSSGCAELDRLLPGGGFHRGTLVEWLSAEEGSGASWLALWAARQACYGGSLEFRERPRPLIVIDDQRDFFPPAAIAAGWKFDQLLVLRPATAADSRWAWDQALRCRGVAAVLGWPQEVPGRVFRRWQLAAEAGSTLGLLIRPAEARNEASWADIRWRVQPIPLGASAEWSFRRRWRLELLRCRGQASGQAVEVEFDDETSALRLVSGLVTTMPEMGGAVAPAANSDSDWPDVHGIGGDAKPVRPSTRRRPG